MFLYPRITLSAARTLVDAVANQPLDVLRERHSENDSLIDPLSSFFAPTGGIRVDSRRLYSLRQSVRNLADALGFPDAPTNAAAAQFDIDCGILLYERMQVAPTEASALEVWAHMTVITMPDIVRWRYYSERSPLDRFIGSSRGVRRNTFGRLWWRAHLFRDAGNQSDAYALLRVLGEDDHVQITERPSVAGSGILARQIASSLHETWDTLHETGQEIRFSERELLRDTMKRIRRRMYMTAFDLLEPETLASVVGSIFASSAQALQQSKTTA